jgi:hypothetical protein
MVLIIALFLLMTTMLFIYWPYMQIAARFDPSRFQNRGGREMPRIGWLPVLGGGVWLGFWITTVVLFPDTSTSVFVSIVGNLDMFLGLCFVSLIIVPFVLAAISAIRDRWKRKQLKRRLTRVLKDDAPYEAAFQAGGKELLFSLAFAELFVARCLDVREVAEPGKPKREYRIRDDVDISLLSGLEEIVARNLSSFKSFPQLQLALEECARSSRVRPGALSLFGEDSRQDEPVEVAERYQKILHDALASNREAPMCGV